MAINYYDLFEVNKVRSQKNMFRTDPLPPADADVSITRFAASVIVLTSLWGCGLGGDELWQIPVCGGQKWNNYFILFQ